MTNPLEYETYASHGKGLNTVQEPMNADPETLALSRNAFLSEDGSAKKKRQGSTYLFDSFNGSIKKIFDYRSLDGKEEVIFQAGDEIFREEDSGWTRLGAMQSAEEVRGTQFNGRLIMGSSSSDPRKYFYLQSPVKPILQSVSGGSLGDRILFVVVSYNSSNGETIVSQPSRIDLNDGELLKVLAPEDQEGASSWNVYVGDIQGDWTLQQTGISLDKDWIQPTNGISEGNEPPGENTAWVFTEVGGEPFTDTLDPPGEPTLDEQTSGSLPQRTYYVVITYWTDDGETLASEQGVIDLSANHVLQVTTPSDPPPEATAWSVYASENDGEWHFQEDTNGDEKLDFNTNFVEPDGGLRNGRPPPDTNQAEFEDPNAVHEPPRGTVYHAHNGRVLVADSETNRMRIAYSELNNEDTWRLDGMDDPSAADPGLIELERVIDEGDRILEMRSIHDILVILLEDHIVTYDFPEDITQVQKRNVLNGGVVATEAALTVGNDVLFLSKHGVESLAQKEGLETMGYPDDNPSKPINNLLQEDIKKANDQGTDRFIEMAYWNEKNWVLLLMPRWGDSEDVTDARIYVFDRNFGIWTFFEGWMARSITTTSSGRWLMGRKDNLIEAWDGSYDDDGDPIKYQLGLPWVTPGHPIQTKTLKEITVALEARQPTTCTVRWLFDHKTDRDNWGEKDVKVDAEGVTKWEESEWETQIADTARVIEPIRAYGRGRFIKVVIEEESTKPFQVNYLTLGFILGSTRKVTSHG